MSCNVNEWLSWSFMHFHMTNVMNVCTDLFKSFHIASVSSPSLYVISSTFTWGDRQWTICSSWNLALVMWAYLVTNTESGYASLADTEPCIGNLRPTSASGWPGGELQEVERNRMEMNGTILDISWYLIILLLDNTWYHSDIIFCPDVLFKKMSLL